MIACASMGNPDQTSTERPGMLGSGSVSVSKRACLPKRALKSLPRFYQALMKWPNGHPQLLDRAFDLLQEDIPIDVALAHLFADSRSHLDIEIRDITLALDALIEANAFKTNGATVIDPNAYKALLPTLQSALGESLKGHPKRDELIALMDRLRTANDVSHGERRRKFLIELA